MRVFVAGATSVLGRALVRQLLAGGHRVRGPIEADLLEDDLAALVGGCDAVVHVATALPSAPVVGARRLLDAALACHVPRYLQQSVVTAYRDGGDDWLDEETALDDSTARSATCRPVIELEAAVRAVDPAALAWTILRGGTFVGPGTGEALIESLQAGDVVVAGDGSNYFSPVTVGDMASAVVAALALAPAGSTFNVVDEPLRYGDYLDALADLIGVARPPRAPELPLPPSWRCTNQAARRVLEWMPRERIWPYVAVGRSRRA